MYIEHNIHKSNLKKPSKMKNIITFSITFFTFLLSFGQGTVKAEFGFADSTIPELSQYEYYRGVWNTKMEMKQKNGAFIKLDAIATVKGQFLEDHKTFQSQFTTPDGFFSTDVRTFNTITKEWKALFINAKAQRWHEFTSKIVDGKMTTIVIGGYSGKEKFDIKAVDNIISDNNYQRNIYYSYDQMKTWVLVYKMYATKV